MALLQSSIHTFHVIVSCEYTQLAITVKSFKSVGIFHLKSTEIVYHLSPTLLKATAYWWMKSNLQISESSPILNSGGKLALFTSSCVFLSLLRRNNSSVVVKLITFICKCICKSDSWCVFSFSSSVFFFSLSLTGRLAGGPSWANDRRPGVLTRADLSPANVGCPHRAEWRLATHGWEPWPPARGQRQVVASPPRL